MNQINIKEMVYLDIVDGTKHDAMMKESMRHHLRN
uniref:Uncharacterized protein n=1 Tax=Arundo donax TaxID=35708 RepID=A0A0A9CC26_ARUDO